MLQWRLKAFRYWEKLVENQATPTWAKVHYPPINYQDIIYYSAPKPKRSCRAWTRWTLNC